MKKSPIIILLAVLLVMSLLLAACIETEATSFTVTFITEGATHKTISVDKGKKITAEIEDPVSTNEDAEFAGWFKGETENAAKWNFQADIVTQNISLYAKWNIATTSPTALSMSQTAFTNSIVWIQKNLADDAVVQVKFFSLASKTEIDGAMVYTYSDSGTLIDGTFTVSSADNTARWTPSVVPAGGLYRILLTVGDESVFATEMLFKGNGASANPYLVADTNDIKQISHAEGNVGQEKFYKLYNDISFEDSDYQTDRSSQQNSVFLGSFDGSNHTITLVGNCGLFYAVGNGGTVKNLILDGAISTGTWPGIGAVADRNDGMVQNCTVYTNVTSTVADVIADITKRENGGAGGIIGINKQNGTIKSCIYRGVTELKSEAGVVKATIGGGCIAGTNYGLITECENLGCFGAYNSVESGKSLSTYSYSGGIVGFNYGTIEKSCTRSTGKVLAQRPLTDVEAVEKNNIALGGIAGYNAQDAVINECYFEGIRVHGDQCVGGIAGINAGSITNSYSGGKYFTSTNMRSYIGGRLEVGGIAGRIESAGTISNCFNTANVFAYSEQAYAIASNASSSVSISVNHDMPASTYGTPNAGGLKAPVGLGNVMINNSPFDSQSDTFVDNYKLAASYISTLGDKFLFDADQQTIRHSWKPAASADSIEVTFIVNSETVAVKLSLDEEESQISVPIVDEDTYAVTGWALTDGGEKIFGSLARLTYEDLLEYSVSGKITLYGIVEEKDNPSPKNALVIAFWSRYINLTIGEALEQSLEEYLAANEIDITTLIFRYYSENAVADFSNAIKNDGDVDIIIGAGSNIDSVSNLGALVTEKVEITVKDQSSRYCAYLSLGGNSENVELFRQFIATDEAKEALDPKPAATITPEAKIVVAIWSPYVHDDVAAALEVAFANYLTANGYVIDNVEFRKYNQSKVADLATAVNADGDVDIILGGGNTLNASAIGASFVERIDGITIVQPAGTASARNVIVLNSGGHTNNIEIFKAFIAEDSTKAVLNPIV